MDDLSASLELTKKMIEGAKLGDWESVQACSTERFERLEHFFSEDIPADNAAEVEEAIIRLKSLDRQLTVLCDAGREELTNKLQSINKSKAGTAAYNANS